MYTFKNLTNVIPARARFAGFLAALLLLALACTPLEAELIQGILQDVDAANGEITIVTKDGKTITLTISTDAPVDTEGTASSFETLEPGVAIEVNVSDDGQHATKISARQSKVHGTVISIDGNKVTIQNGDDSTVVVTVDETTRIELEEDSHGSLADITVGANIEAKFDPETDVAFKLELEQEKREIEGWVQSIVGDQLTIRTENGDEFTVTADENAKIELSDDTVGTLADIVDGLKIEVDFDPSSLAAFKIEIEHDEQEDEIEGRVKSFEDNLLIIETENGEEFTVTVDENVKIELADDSLGTVADILDGLEIEVDFDPSSLVAFKIEIEHDGDDHDNSG